jgi:hypothetical protein
MKTPPNPPSPRIAYRLDETAKLLGISTISIRRAIKRGLIRPSRAFRTPLISQAELERFIAESSLPAANPTATPKTRPQA